MTFDHAHALQRAEVTTRLAFIAALHKDLDHARKLIEQDMMDLNDELRYLRDHGYITEGQSLITSADGQCTCERCRPGERGA